jgi:hypothetical protein
MMKKTACELEHNVWDVVADESASAVRYGFKGTCFYFLPFSKSIDVLFFLNDYKDLLMLLFLPYQYLLILLLDSCSISLNHTAQG